MQRFEMNEHQWTALLNSPEPVIAEPDHSIADLQERAKELKGEYPSIRPTQNVKTFLFNPGILCKTMGKFTGWHTPNRVKEHNWPISKVFNTKP